MRIWALFGVAALSCGGGNDGGVGEEAGCSKSDRTGTYLVEFTTVDGDCGRLPSSVVKYKNGEVDQSAIDVDCEVESAEWSDDECALEVSSTCVDATTTSKSVGVSRANADGSTITSVLTLTVTGDVECIGTYESRATRQ